MDEANELNATQGPPLFLISRISLYPASSLGSLFFRAENNNLRINNNLVESTKYDMVQCFQDIVIKLNCKHLYLI